MESVKIKETTRTLENVIVKDSGMSWVMLFACFLISLTIYGVNRVSGVFFVAYRELTNMSRESASWPFNMAGASAMVVSPLSGFLLTKFTSRTIAWVSSIMFAVGHVCCFFSLDVYYISIFYGIIAGAGVAIWSTAVPLVINENFDIHRATAFGISSVGAPIGSFVFPAFTQLCLEEYGLKGTFLVLGGISLNACIGAALLALRQQAKPIELNQENALDTKYNSKDESNETNTATTNLSELQGINSKNEKNLSSNLAIILHIISKPHFYLILLTQNVILNQIYTYNLVAIDYANDIGVSESNAVWILALFSLGDVIGRICFGWVTDKHLLSRQMFMGAQMILAGVCFFVLTIAGNFLMLAVVSVFIGLTLGTLLSVSTIIITDYIRIEAYTWTISLIRTSGGIVTLLRPPILGYFRDDLGTYDGLFQITAGVAIIFGILWILDQFWIRIRNSHENLPKCASVFK